MEPAPLEPLEPLNEAGPEMPSAPGTSRTAAPPAARTVAPLTPGEGPDAAIAPIILGTADSPAPAPEPLTLAEPPPPPPVGVPPTLEAAAPALVAAPPVATPPPVAAAPARGRTTSTLSLPMPAATKASAPTPAPAASTTTAATAAAAAAAAAPSAAMDRDFILRNQIAERYISGRLPLKGATDFERFCRENPALLDELGLPERVNAGLRLLEAAGKPEPWAAEPKKIWEKPQVVIGLAAATLALVIGLAVVLSDGSAKSARIAKLQKQVAEQPLEPATSTRTIRLLPNYKGGTNTPAVVIGTGETQLADLKLDLSRSDYKAFRITIDRIDQGRVMVLHNVQKDSNGHVRLALNTSALGPGNYQFSIEGLTWRGEARPEAWITVGVQR